MEQPITLGVLSPYPEFSQHVRNIARRLGVRTKISEVIFSKGCEIAVQWEQAQEVDAIISRGATAWMVRQRVSLPVISVDISNYEVLKALYEAKRQGRHPIALVDFKYRTTKLDTEFIAEATGVNFSTITYEDEQDLVEQLMLAYRQGIKTVIATGDYVVKAAVDCGLHGILIHRDPLAIQQALEEAVRIATFRRQTEQFFDHLYPIFASSLEAIVIVNNQGVITFVNGPAEKILGIKAEHLEGTLLSRLPGWGEVADLRASARRSQTKHIINSGDKQIAVTCLNTAALGPTQGAIFLLRLISAEKLAAAPRAGRDPGQAGLVAKFHFDHIIGESPALKEAVQTARRYARSEGTVLITGQSGTGKELFAQSIHNASNRRRGAFVAVNCAAFPENLLESELFGYEEGAFTGARRGGKPGLFELANGGSIFLDEVEELSPALQVRLLRTLQEKEIMHVGGDKVIPVDIRVIAATNQDLVRAVQEGKFRRDLYFRLNVLPLYVPPLHERGRDIILLFKYFLGQHSCPPEKQLELLLDYSWPGNIRELENFVSRYVALGEEDTMNFPTFTRLVRELRQAAKIAVPKEEEYIVIRPGPIEEMESQLFEQITILFPDKSRSELADILGISRTTLWRKLRGPRQI